ncbi:hypothetical protein PCYB_006880, partial [Plasmodium cynomolgi strain B]
LSIGDCLGLYVDISNEIEKKISELQDTRDVDIRKKCVDLDNHINTQKENYKKCEKHYLSNDSINIENYIEELSTQYHKYTKCSSESTSNGKGDDKSKPETKELCKDPAECPKEQVLPEEKISESSCKKELSKPGCLQQGVYSEHNVDHSAVADDTTAEQQNTVASTASTLNDPVESNCPLNNSSYIEVSPSPSSPSQPKLNLIPDVKSDNPSHNLLNNEQYSIHLVHDEHSYIIDNGCGPSNGYNSDEIIIKLLKKPSPKRKYGKIHESDNQGTSKSLLIILKGLSSLKIPIINTILYNLYHLHQRYS